MAKRPIDSERLEVTECRVPATDIFPAHPSAAHEPLRILHPRLTPCTQESFDQASSIL